MVSSIRELLVYSLKYCDVQGMAGALFGGVTCDRWPQYTDALMAMALGGMAVSLALKPWVPSLSGLCILSAINGVCHGLLKIGRYSY